VSTVRFENVCKRFGEISVVERLNLTIEAGEFFTFLGPSGCGKSTLLHLIAGIESPTTGSLYFDGRRVDHLPPGERDVAMVFQSYALYPHMTVYDNLAFPLRNRRLPRTRIAEEVERTARLLDLETLLKRKPRELSGGQRQRVALGRALIRRPRVFLLDEPLSNLDARLRLEMREELKQLHTEQRITTVYVTHDQEEALALSNRIAVLQQGRIHQCGTPEEIYRLPSNLFVAGFVGTPPMNLLPGAAMRALPPVEARLAAYGLQSVVVGVRPGDVTVRAEETDETIRAAVVLIEPMGNDLWIVGDWKGQHIRGRAAPGEVLRPGASASFEVLPQALHLFDEVSGQRLG